MYATLPLTSGNEPVFEEYNSRETALHLLTLLLKCADYISAGDLTTAGDLLPEILELSSPFGSPADRVAAFFAHSLSSNLISDILSPPPQTLAIIPHLKQLHTAMQAYNSLTPFVKFSHFTSNQAIYEAMDRDGSDHVHVIDVDIMQGLQWPGLFHILASRPRKVLSVKITGFGPDIKLLAQTGERLAEFANSAGLPFEFNPVEGKLGNLNELSQLGEIQTCGITVVVHWVQHGLYDISGSNVGLLKVLGAVRPRLVTMVEQDYCKTGSFLERFVEALHYYSALFDALGEGLSRDNVERHMVEHQLFGCEIRNVLGLDGSPNKRFDDRVGSWVNELVRAGFEPFPLSGSPATQAGLLLGLFPWKGYTLMEENGWLRLGWKDLPLLTASAWQPKDYDVIRSN